MKALVFLAPGFEEVEAMTVVDFLKRCGVDVTLAGLKEKIVKGSHGVKVVPDEFIEKVRIGGYDAVICPGGSPGWENLRRDKRVIGMVKRAHADGKLVAAICGGPATLSDAGVLRGKRCTIYPGLEGELKKGGGKPERGIVVVDGNLITSMGPATALAFAHAIAEKLVGKKKAGEVAERMLVSEEAKLRSMP